MAVADKSASASASSSDSKVWSFFKLPFRSHNTSSAVNTTTTTTSSSSSTGASQSHQFHHHYYQNHTNQQVDGSNPNPSSNHHAPNSVSIVARSILPVRRRLKLDPSNKLYFPCTYFSIFGLIYFWLENIFRFFGFVAICGLFVVIIFVLFLIMFIVMSKCVFACGSVY